MLLDSQDQKDLARYRRIVKRREYDWRFYQKAIEYFENGKRRKNYLNREIVATRAIEIVRKMMNRGYKAKEIKETLNLSCDLQSIYRLSTGCWIQKAHMQEIFDNYKNLKPEV